MIITENVFIELFINKQIKRMVLSESEHFLQRNLIVMADLFYCTRLEDRAEEQFVEKF